MPWVPQNPPSLTIRVIVSDLLPRRNIRQRPHFQRVVIHSIGLIAVIYVSEVAPNVETIFIVHPEYMLTIRRCGDNIEDTDDLTCANILSGKQSLSVDWMSST
jgi:hypothetical protein